VPDLAGVSETMLWSLYNRASEAQRPDSALFDPESVRIQSGIKYNFAAHFSVPLGSLAARAIEIDRALRSWLDRHPEGIIVSLGEGLETQSSRVDNGRMHWLTVDLPEAMRLRERFLVPTPRFRHIAARALDPVWMDAVDPSSGVFIVAQGLLMYLAPEGVRQLFASIVDRFPASELVFDTIPRWFSDLTMRGVNQTASYRLPSMPTLPRCTRLGTAWRAIGIWSVIPAKSRGRPRGLRLGRNETVSTRGCQCRKFGSTLK
jgi:O-methyltransferase involved in polyketide biosynthesis